MRFPLPVREKLGRIIGEYFSTKKIEGVFEQYGVTIDPALFAKWRITLDAFSKLSNPDEGLPNILEEFCHPLNFDAPESRDAFIRKLNGVLSYVDLRIKASDRNAMVETMDGMPLFLDDQPLPEKETRTSTDYVVEALRFFREEYNKVRMSGLSYDYPLGENPNSEQTNQDYDVYVGRLNAIKRLKDAGFVTEYQVEEHVENEGYYIWDYAVCKIDERQLTDPQETPRATSAGVEAISQRVVHEHTHLFENATDPFKMEITRMPEVQVRSADDAPIAKGKKRVYPPKLPATDWAKASIRFINEREVVITAGTQNVASDFEALGFGNAKTGKPDSAWMFLLELARKGGATDTLPKPIPENIKQHKKTISDRLKALFKNETDPFYDPTETRVYRVKLTLIPPESEASNTDTLGVVDYLTEAMPEQYDPNE